MNGENRLLCSYRWTGWVWGITGWSSRLPEIYISLWRNLWNISPINKRKSKYHTMWPVGLGNTEILTNKVEMREMCLDLVAHLNWKPMFEWYVIWCGCKDGYHKDMCLKRVRLHAQNMITILGSIVNIIGRHIWPFNEHKNLHFDNE